MRMAAEWSEIPVIRRHTYFVITMLLCVLGANLVRDNHGPMDETIVKARVAAQKMHGLATLEDPALVGKAPVFDEDLSLAKPR